MSGLKLKVKDRPVAMNFKIKQRKTDKPLAKEEELLKEFEYLRAVFLVLFPNNEILIIKPV